MIRKMHALNYVIIRANVYYKKSWFFLKYLAYIKYAQKLVVYLLHWEINEKWTVPVAICNFIRLFYIIPVISYMTKNTLEDIVT